MFNSRTTSEIYLLDEAAKKVNCTTNELLRAGANGALQLLVGVPDGTGFRLMEEQHPERARGAPKCTPNILALRISHCHSLYLTGKALIRDSNMGYEFSPNSEFSKYYPSTCDADLPIIGVAEISWKDPRKRWTAWVVYNGEYESFFEVLSTNVLVASIEIDRFFEIKSSAPGNVDQYFKSDMLQYMNQAARIYWGHANVIKEDKTTHPKTTDIVDWFKDRGFSKSLAEKAASILRPEFAGTGRPLEE